jgi:hypothetical protein
MPGETEQARTPVDALAARVRSELIPVTGKFSYFSLLPFGEEELRQYVNEPVAAIAPAAVAALPQIGILLVPYIEKGNGKAVETVVFSPPQEPRMVPSARHEMDGLTAIAIAVKGIDVADYHYDFYNAVSATLADHWAPDVKDAFIRLIREELSAEVHGEVDEGSWRLKQSLLRRQPNTRKETKLFCEYARQAFEDTLTLYLHGACCDIDVETGPRQMPSRYLRRRIELLLSIFPPPEGYAVLPEQLKVR